MVRGFLAKMKKEKTRVLLEFVIENHHYLSLCADYMSPMWIGNFKHRSILSNLNSSIPMYNLFKYTISLLMYIKFNVKAKNS